jgi:hypothetical protein
MTKREAFAMIRELVGDNDALVAFVDHEVELLNKKNSAPKAPTQKQMDNENYKAMMLADMGTDKWTVGQIQKDLFLGKHGIELTNQRVSALVTALKNDGKLIRTVEGRKAYFTVA